MQKAIAYKLRKILNQGDMESVRMIMQQSAHSERVKLLDKQKYENIRKESYAAIVKERPGLGL